MSSTTNTTTSSPPPVDSSISLDILEASEQTASAEGSAEGEALSPEISPSTTEQLALMRELNESCLLAVNQFANTFEQNAAPLLKERPAFHTTNPLSIKMGLCCSSTTSASQSDSSSSNNTLQHPSFSPKQFQGERKNNSTTRIVTSLSDDSSAFNFPGTQKTSCSLTLMLPEKGFTGDYKETTDKFHLTPAILRFSTVSKNSSSTKSSAPSSPYSSSPERQKHTPPVCHPMDLFSTTPFRRGSSRCEERKDHDSQEEGKQDSSRQDQEDRHHEDHSSQQAKKEEELDEIFLESTSSYKKNHDRPLSIIPESLLTFGFSRSPLSEVGLEVTRIDILFLCMEIMKLLLVSRSNDSLERIESRKRLLKKATQLAESFSKQANITKWLSIGTASLGILGAASPLVGQTAGRSLVESLKKVSSLFSSVQTDVFFQSVGEVCSSLSKLMDSSSKIYELTSSADRTRLEQYKELFKMETEEQTRSIEELKDFWKNMENFLLQVLQSEHEAIRALYQ